MRNKCGKSLKAKDHACGVLLRVSRWTREALFTLACCLILGLCTAHTNAACNVACLSVHETPNCFSVGIVQNSADDAGEILISRPHVPIRITFEVSVSVCGPGDVMTFYLNDVPLGSTPVDPRHGCVCSPGVQQFVVADTQVIETAWLLNGKNVLRFTKTSNGGSYYSWVRAVLDDGRSRMTACINDYQGGNCDVLNQCSATYTSSPINASAVVESPFEEILLRQAYAGTELPSDIDLSGLSDGVLHLTITGRNGRDRASLRKSGHRSLKMNRPCNSPPVVSCTRELLAECGAVADLSFTASDVDGDTLNYQISVNGTAMQSGVVDASGLVRLQAALPAGVYNVLFAVQDSATAAECTTSLTVQDTRPPEIFVRGDNPAVLECHGVFVDPGVNAGDACAGDLTGNVVTTGVVDTAVPGSYTLTYSVTDGNGNTATAFRVVHVVNSAPIVHSFTGPAEPVQIGTPIVVNFAFADANLGQGHLAVLDWGDGTQSPLALSTHGTFGVQHAYSLPGVYTVGLSVTDSCGAQVHAMYQYVVVFDPNGGFVTGGGWLDSPAGAYLAHPTAVGRAYFGFVAKIHNGDTAPRGNTHLQLRAANMRFESTSYESLVVLGNRAQLRGSGRINASGDYVFVLTATDLGSTDHLRLQIMNRSTGAMVYDNAAATLIGGGNISVHR